MGGRIIAEALRNAGLKVEPHFKWFRGDTPDESWLPVVGRNGWVVLMRDLKIGKRKLQTETLIASGVKSFVLTSGNLKNVDNARIFISAIPKMLDMIRNNKFPFIAKVSRQGTVKMWIGKEKTRKRRRGK